MKQITDVISKMIEYYSGDPRRINHFLKVYSFAKTIGEKENLDSKTQNILEIAAVTHDIGIKNSEKKYNSSAGKYQEIEGVPESEKLLSEIGIERDIIDRVKYLIAHHHTYTNIDRIDYRILVEADFLVNAYEDNLSIDSIIKIREKVFRTKSGIEFLNNIFQLNN